MRVSLLAKPRLLAVGLFATSLALAGAGRAEAQSVLFSGFTTGCFDTGGGCTGVSGPVSYPNSAGLTFTGTNFSGTSTNGVLTVSDFGTLYYNNLQPFNWTTNTTTFVLYLNFTNPTSNQTIFTAALTGTVVAPIGQNPLTVTFPSGVQTWTDGTYVYSAAVNSLVVVPETDTSITGELTATPVQAIPEPISMILVGTGLAGLGVVRRRRAKAAQADLI